MVDKFNNTYDYIIDYIKNNKTNLNIEELKFLLNYAAILKENNLENIMNADIGLIIGDLKKLHKNISDGQLTSISFQRLETELKLFDAILKNENLDDISYELDKLYIECDMGVRENSVLAKRLSSTQSKKVSK